MKYPALARGGRLAATVPVLDGGLSRSYAAGDRQPFVCRNMVMENGRLCTRRGFVTDEKQYHGLALGSRSSFFTDSDGYLLVMDWHNAESVGNVVVTVFDDRGCDVDRAYTVTGKLGLSGFLVSAGASLPLYTSLLFVNDGRIYGLNAKAGRFDALNDGAYVPLVWLNATPSNDGWRGGDAGEPLNALTAKFRCTYTADGEGMHYALPSVKADTALVVSLTTAVGTTRYRIESWEDHVQLEGGDGVSFNRRLGTFCFTRNGEPYAVPDLGLHNHIEAVAESDKQPTVAVGTMRFGTWYGGNACAEGGGSRLFLGGDNGYVMWSTPDKPLYFPVTAYAQIGDADDALTAFGKLGEWLVVFKRRSLYAIAYVRDSRVAGVDLTTADVTATAIFPIIPLNAEIGCDLPDTVAVQDNRLLFARRDGSVYALSITANARRLDMVSEPVRACLDRPTNAAAVTVNGRYILLWGQTLYLYDRDGRWCEWSFEQTGGVPLGLCRNDKGLHVPMAVTVGHSDLLFWFGEGDKADTVVYATGTSWADAEIRFEQRTVEGHVETKLYDVGFPDTAKRLTAVFADVEADGEVTAWYRTEHGVTAESRTVVRDGIRLTPSIARCRQFALCLRGANLKLGGITFHVITR